MILKEVLSHCDADSFRMVADSAVDGLCGRTSIKVDTSLSSEEFQFLSKAIQLGVESIVKFGLKNSQIPSDEWAEVDGKFIEILHDCLQKRNSDASKQIKLALLMGRNGPRLQNYDWNVKWVLGSNSLSSLEEPLANIQLFLSDGTTHYIEVNRSELNNFIEVLESK